MLFLYTKRLILELAKSGFNVIDLSFIPEQINAECLGRDVKSIPPSLKSISLNMILVPSIEMINLSSKKNIDVTCANCMNHV